MKLEIQQNRIYGCDEISYTVSTYEKVLKNEIKSFSPYFFEKKYRRQRIVTLMKYLIENKLNISPEEAIKKLSIATLKEYRLICLLKYLEDYKPIEYETDPVYVAHLVYYAYPALSQPSLKEKTIECYQEVLAEKRKFFPKNYFIDKYGEERAKICFEYLWQHILNMKFEDIPIMFLENNEKGLEILKKYKLKILTQMIYYSVSDMILNMYPDIDLSEICNKE